MAAMLKFLRIAVTALSLTVCVLLVTLWVRSFWKFDSISGNFGDRNLSVISAQGTFRVGAVRFGPQWFTRALPWSWSSDSIGEEGYGFRLTVPNGTTIQLRRVFLLSTSGTRTFLWMPYWLPMLLAVLMASIPWLAHARRFGLRTLLIATTLVAVGLGLIAPL
jgi:hypothetical protein